MRLAAAQAAVAAALAHGARAGAPPLAVAVLDAGGQLVAAARGDGAGLFRLDLARGKALGALGFGADSRALAARAEASPAFFTSAAIVAGGGLVLSAGGLLVPAPAGGMAGAIGVSGAAPDLDEACAAAGKAAMEGVAEWHM